MTHYFFKEDKDFELEFLKPFAFRFTGFMECLNWYNNPMLLSSTYNNNSCTIKAYQKCHNGYQLEIASVTFFKTTNSMRKVIVKGGNNVS